MTYKVLDIEQSDGMTSVYFQVPSFTNFGDKLGELEAAAFEAMTAVSDSEADEEDADLNGDLDSLRSELNRELATLRQHHPQFAEMIDTTTKELLSLADPDEFGDLGSLLFDDEDEEDEENELPEDAIAVCLPDGEAWTAAYATRANDFFAAWPDYRDSVRAAAYDYYCKYQELHWETLEDQPEALILLPELTEVSQIDDRFIIHTLHLHPDGTIGLEGDCLWDDDQGIGILMEDGAVVRVGQAAVAYP